MKHMAVLMALLAFAGVAQAKTAFTGQDYSGVYECKGMDAHEGAYAGTVTMKLVPEQSIGNHGSYQFRLDVPGFGAYPGYAVAEGNKLAIHFALQDPATKDYGVGIATVSKGKSGKWAFKKFYYEPEYKGGNTGTEECAIK